MKTFSKISRRRSHLWLNLYVSRIFRKRRKPTKLKFKSCEFFEPKYTIIGCRKNRVISHFLSFVFNIAYQNTDNDLVEMKLTHKSISMNLAFSEFVSIQKLRVILLNENTAVILISLKFCLLLFCFCSISGNLCESQ